MVDGSWSQGCEFLRITCVLVMLFRKMVAISLYAFIILQQCIWIFSYVLVEPTCLCYVIFPFLCAQLCVDISVSCLRGFLVSPLLVSRLYVFVLDSVLFYLLLISCALSLVLLPLPCFPVSFRCVPWCIHLPVYIWSESPSVLCRVLPAAVCSVFHPCGRRLWTVLRLKLSSSVS